MGMGAAPAHATVISKTHLAELCPDQMQRLEAKLKELDVTLGQLAESLDETSSTYEDYESIGISSAQFSELYTLWQAVCNRFVEKTMVGGRGLEVCLCYYDSERGDRYDEIEGDFFFAVDGVYQFTPAGERFRGKLEEKSWTVFG